MTVDLIAFITARLDEDHEAARKAASLCGCHPPAPAWRFDDDSTDGRILIKDDPHPGAHASPSRLRKCWNGSYANLFAARHIVLHDPDRVLRDVAFKRELLGSIRSALADDATDASAEWQLQILAAVWSGHPDYRTEWSPETVVPPV